MEINSSNHYPNRILLRQQNHQQELPYKQQANASTLYTKL